MLAASRVARALVRSSAARAPFALPAFGGRCRRARSSAHPRDEEADAADEADDTLVDMDAFLAPLRNHERTGVPKGAGVASDAAARFDLGRMRRLLAALGDPHVGYPVIHVAGTKGKGSVVSFLAAVLREAGVNTGTYKSPHVKSTNERIVCGPFLETKRTRRGASGDDTEKARLSAGGALDAATAETTRAFAARESSSRATRDATDDGGLSYFEALTAFAFRAFKQNRVECAVVEVGVGGSVDATNVVPDAFTAASVLTALGDDHLEALGGSLGAVAAAKAGIARARRPVFVGAQPSIEHEALLLSNVYAAGARLVDEGDVAVKAVPRGVEASGGGSVAQTVDFEIASRPRGDDGAKPLETRALRGVRMRALGPHQRENARLAVSVIEFLRKGGGRAATAATRRWAIGTRRLGRASTTTTCAAGWSRRRLRGVSRFSAVPRLARTRNATDARPCGSWPTARTPRRRPRRRSRRSERRASFSAAAAASKKQNATASKTPTRRLVSRWWSRWPPTRTTSR